MDDGPSKLGKFLFLENDPFQNVYFIAENCGDPAVHQAGDSHHDRVPSPWLCRRQVAES